MENLQQTPKNHVNSNVDPEVELSATYDELQKVVGSLDDISSIMHKITTLKNEIKHKDKKNEYLNDSFTVQRGCGFGHTVNVTGGAKLGLQQQAGKALSSLEGLAKQVADEQEIHRHRHATKLVEETHQKAKGLSASSKKKRPVPTVMAELRRKLESNAQKESKMPSPGPKTLTQKEKNSVLTRLAPKDPTARATMKLFQPFDIDRDGTVNHSEFRQGMVSLGFRPDEATSLIPVLDPENKGAIEYGRLHDVEPSPEVLQRAESEHLKTSAKPTFARSMSDDLKISGAGTPKKAAAPSSLRDQMVRARIKAKEKSISIRSHLKQNHTGVPSPSKSGRAKANGKPVDLADATEKALLRKLAKGGVGSLKKVLRQKDASHAGALDAKELNQGLLKYGVALAPNEIAALSERYRKEGSQDAVDYESMLNKMELTLRHTDRNRAHDINRRVCRKVSEALSRTPHDKVQELFRQWDTDGNGTIDQQELKNGLQTLGLSLPPYEFQELIQVADTNKDGVINYEELEHLVENRRAEFEQKDKCQRFQQDTSGKYPLHLQSSTVIDNQYVSPSKVPTALARKERVTLKRLADLVGSHGGNIQKDLQKVSIKKKGHVSLSDIQKGLKKNGVQIAETDLKTILAKNGKSGSEQMPLREFCSMMGLEKKQQPEASTQGGIFRLKEETALANPTFGTSMFDTSSDWMPLKKTKPRMHTEDEVRVSRFFEPSDKPEPLMPVSLTGMVRAKSCPPGTPRTRGSLNESSMVSQILTHRPHTPSRQPLMVPSSQGRTLRARTPSSEVVRPPPFAVDVRAESRGSRIKFTTSASKNVPGKPSSPVSRSLASHFQQQSGISQSNNSMHYIASNNNSSFFQEP